MTARSPDEAVVSDGVDKTVDGKPAATPEREAEPAAEDVTAPEDVKELGGPRGPEPTRYGDWEKGGRCSDF